MNGTYVGIYAYIQSLLYLIRSRKIKLRGGKVWRIDSFQAFGKRKIGELIDQPKYYLL